MGEQARDQEEARHSEEVNGEEDHGGDRRVVGIRHDPDGDREIGHGGVQDDAQQQGGTAQGVEAVQAVGRAGFA
jgi:hypothetical protein